MSDRPLELAQMLSWADATPPWPGACLPWDALVHRAAGLEGLTVYDLSSPDHPPVEAIRREGEADMIPIAARPDADPLFRQGGSLDEGWPRAPNGYTDVTDL